MRRHRAALLVVAALACVWAGRPAATGGAAAPRAGTRTETLPFARFVEFAPSRDAFRLVAGGRGAPIVVDPLRGCGRAPRGA